MGSDLGKDPEPAYPSDEPHALPVAQPRTARHDIWIPFRSMKSTQDSNGFQAIDLDTLDAVSGGGWRDYVPTWMGGTPSSDNNGNQQYQEPQQQQYDQQQDQPFDKPFYSEPSPIPGGGQIDFYPDPFDDMR